MVKEYDVVCHGLDGLSMFVGMREDLVARDDTALHFIQDDVATEFDQRPAFVPRNGAGVWFKEAEHLLVRGDFLALEDPAARLRNHPLHQGEYPLSLGAQSRCLPL